MANGKRKAEECEQHNRGKESKTQARRSATNQRRVTALESRGIPEVPFVSRARNFGMAHTRWIYAILGEDSVMANKSRLIEAGKQDVSQRS